MVGLNYLERNDMKKKKPRSMYSRFTTFEEETTGGRMGGAHYVSVVEKHSPDCHGQRTPNRKPIQLVGHSTKPITGKGKVLTCMVVTIYRVSYRGGGLEFPPLR